MRQRTTAGVCWIERRAAHKQRRCSAHGIEHCAIQPAQIHLVTIAICHQRGVAVLGAVLVSYRGIINFKLKARGDMNSAALRASAGLGLGDSPLILIALAVRHDKGVSHAIRVRIAHLKVVSGEVDGIEFRGRSVGILSTCHTVQLVCAGIRAGDRITVSCVGRASLASGILLV